MSKRVFEERVTVFYENMYRVTAAILEHFGYQPEVDGFDQKPFHVNESGSKNRKTLEWTGAKQCHGSTRDRWTNFTTTTTAQPLDRVQQLLFRSHATLDFAESCSSDSSDMPSVRSRSHSRSSSCHTSLSATVGSSSHGSPDSLCECMD